MSLVGTARLLTKQFFKAGIVMRILLARVGRIVLNSSSVMMMTYVKGLF